MQRCKKIYEENIEKYPGFDSMLIDKYLKCLDDRTETNIDIRNKKTYFTLQKYIDTLIIKHFTKDTKDSNRNTILLFILFGIILYVFSNIRNTTYNTLNKNQQKIFNDCVEIFTLIPLFQILINENDDGKQIELFRNLVKSYARDLVNYLNDICEFAKETKENVSVIKTEIRGMKLWKDDVSKMYKKKPVLTALYLLATFGPMLYDIGKRIKFSHTPEEPVTRLKLKGDLVVIEPVIHSSAVVLSDTSPLLSIPGKKSPGSQGFVCIEPISGDKYAICAAQAAWHKAISAENIQPSVQPIRPSGKVATDFCQSHPEKCKGNLGIYRFNMPQVEVNDVAVLLEDYNITNKSYEITPTTIYNAENGVFSFDRLIPTQNEADAGKISGMGASLDAGKLGSGPIYISQDGFIIDGHHRYYVYKKFMTHHRFQITCHH